MRISGSHTSRGSIGAWVLYDVAAHGYGLMIPAVGYAIYFTSFIAAAHPLADGLWSLAVALPLIAAGLISPWLGAVVDSHGHRRTWLAAATIACGLATALMVTLEQGDIAPGIALFAVAQLASLLAGALYNAYLPQISTPENSARISGIGWGLSYLGGIACFLLCLPFIRGGIVPGNESHFAQAFLVTAVFLLAVGLAAISRFPREIRVDRNTRSVRPYRQIWATICNWRNEREIPKFLLAYYLLNDAMVTVIFFAAIFFKTTFGLSVQQVLMYSLAFQLIAIPATMFFGWLGDRWSQRGALNVTLLIWAVVLALMGWADGEYAPLAIVIVLGLVLGSTQSLCRSMFSRMIPTDRTAEHFGFHALAGRASSALGPLLFGAVSAMAGSQRMAMVSLGVFLVTGGILMSRVRLIDR
ncbi:MAG: MFS transporter [Dechloromonas sp.]|nr:MFS transporter [Dechloromonas sp.]